MRTLRTGGARAVLLAALGLVSAAFTADWLAENPHYGYVTKEGEFEPWLAAYLPTIWAVAAGVILVARRLGRWRALKRQDASAGGELQGAKVTERTFVGGQTIRSSRAQLLLGQPAPNGPPPS